MSESSPSERSHKDPIRIVYHAGDRTFARLFNERSLEEVKDVVRRKLGLGSQTDVSLKQMGSDALLDLEDDDDFEAFRVLLKFSVSVDIQVTVGKSQGSSMPPPVARQPGAHPSASKATITTLPTSPSKEPAGVAASGQPTAHPEVARTTEASATPAKTPEPLKRKRKVSFDGAGAAAADKPSGQHALAKPISITPIASAKTAESPVAPKPVGPEEPPKKKQKKEPTKTKAKTKTKDVQIMEAVSPTKTSASKPKAKKSTTLDRGSKAGTSVPEDAETSEPPAKKEKKQKKDDTTGPKKSSASVDQDDMDQSNSEVHFQPAAEEPSESCAEGDTLKIRKSEKAKAPKGTACAAIPRTSASASVQSEVAAAILSGYLSKASETIPPEPPAKRKYVRRNTKKSSVPSSALPAEPIALDAPANGTPNVPTEHRLEHVVLTSEPPPQTPDLNGPPCPICLEAPFHIRYYCPVVLKGPDAIRERLEELKRANTDDQQSLIKQLEGLLCDPKVTSELSLDAAQIDGVQLGNVSPSPNASLLRTPNIPSNSHLFEVTVENRDEGSSSESSDDMSEGVVELQEFLASQRQRTPDEQLLPSKDDLEPIVRGPVSKKQSILHLLDRIVGDEDEDGSGSEEDKAELEEDTDEEAGRSRRLSSRRITHSSDSESEEEESSSPSPSRSAKGTSNHLGPSVQGFSKPVEESAEHQEGDVIMKDFVDPPVPEGQDGDSSEETHVGSEDRMVIDLSAGEKGAAIVTEEQSSSPVPSPSVLQSSDAPSDEPQESAKTEVDRAPNRDGSVPVVSVLEEVAADPIEPADDLAPPTVSRLSNADPIEAPSEDIESLFATVASSTPKPGVSKRLKTRDGQILDDEADRPVLLEQLAPEVTDGVTPIPPRGKSRRKVTETPTSQQPATTRRSPRFSSLPPSTSTPAAVVLLHHRSKSGARSSKAAKTPAKQSEERSDVPKSSAKDNTSLSGARIAPTPSVIRWETLAEPSSPSVQLDDPSMLIDELMPSSPHPDSTPICGRPNDKEKRGRLRKPACSSQAENSQEKERLFDPSSSQIPFPYSQNLTNSVAAAVPNGNESEGTTDLEDEPKVVKKKTKMFVQYRPLSQLASQAALFSPSLPTPANKSAMNGKAKKRGVEDSSFSSSSSSDTDEANGSEHIPRERRAGSVLETKKKKSLLSRI